jgi:CBS domain-containing protein
MMFMKSIREIVEDRIHRAISPDATLEAASDLMAEARLQALPVVEDGELVGIVTERDILRHVSQRGGFATAQVAEAMTREVVRIETRDSVVDALVRMQAHGFRHLPVIDMGGKVVAMLTLDDIPFECKVMRAEYVEWRRGVIAAE